jgi:hypothetical protein
VQSSLPVALASHSVLFAFKSAFIAVVAVFSEASSHSVDFNSAFVAANDFKSPNSDFVQNVDSRDCNSDFDAQIDPSDSTADEI